MSEAEETTVTLYSGSKRYLGNDNDDEHHQSKVAKKNSLEDGTMEASRSMSMQLKDNNKKQLIGVRLQYLEELFQICYGFDRKNTTSSSTTIQDLLLNSRKHAIAADGDAHALTHCERLYQSHHEGVIGCCCREEVKKKIVYIMYDKTMKVTDLIDTLTSNHTLGSTDPETVVWLDLFCAHSYGGREQEEEEVALREVMEVIPSMDHVVMIYTPTLFTSITLLWELYWVHESNIPIEIVIVPSYQSVKGIVNALLLEQEAAAVEDQHSSYPTFQLAVPSINTSIQDSTIMKAIEKILSTKEHSSTMSDFQCFIEEETIRNKTLLSDSFIEALKHCFFSLGNTNNKDEGDEAREQMVLVLRYRILTIIAIIYYQTTNYRDAFFYSSIAHKALKWLCIDSNKHETHPSSLILIHKLFSWLSNHFVIEDDSDSQEKEKVNENEKEIEMEIRMEETMILKGMEQLHQDYSQQCKERLDSPTAGSSVGVQNEGDDSSRYYRLLRFDYLVSQYVYGLHLYHYQQPQQHVQSNKAKALQVFQQCYEFSIQMYNNEQCWISLTIYEYIGFWYCQLYSLSPSLTVSSPLLSSPSVTDGMTILETVYQQKVNLLGPDHLETIRMKYHQLITCLSTTTTTTATAGSDGGYVSVDIEEIIVVCQELVNIVINVYGSHDFYTIDLQLQLVKLYQQRQHPQQQQKQQEGQEQQNSTDDTIADLLTQCIQKYDSLLGSQHRKTFETRLLWIKHLLLSSSEIEKNKEQEAIDEKLSLANELYEDMKTVLGDKDLVTLQVLVVIKRFQYIHVDVFVDENVVFEEEEKTILYELIQVQERLYQQARNRYGYEDDRTIQYGLDLIQTIHIALEAASAPSSSSALSPVSPVSPGDDLFIKEYSCKGLSILQQIYSCYLKHYGNAHPMTLQIVVFIAQFPSYHWEGIDQLSTQKRQEELINWLTEQYSWLVQVFGQDDTQTTLLVLKRLAIYSRDQQEYGKACHYYQLIHESYERLYGEAAQETLLAMMDHAFALSLSGGEWSKGIEMAEMAVQLAEALHGPFEEVTVSCVDQLGKLYCRSMSETHHQHGLTLYEKWYERYRHDPIERAGDEGDGEEEREGHGEGREEGGFGEYDDRTLKMLSGIGEVYLTMNEITLGVCVLQNVYDKQKELLGDDHCDTKKTAMRLEHMRANWNENEHEIETGNENEMETETEHVVTQEQQDTVETNTTTVPDIVASDSVAAATAVATADSVEDKDHDVILTDSFSIRSKKRSNLQVFDLILCHSFSIPVELRSLCIHYLYIPLHNDNIRQTVQAWCRSSSREASEDREKVLQRYGHISTWDTSRITTMEMLFYDMSEFNDSLNDWDVSQVTNMSSMFQQAIAFNQPLNQWNVSQVTNMRYMFHYAKAFNQQLESWDVSHVTDMSGMFAIANQFNQCLNRWNVSQVMDMNYMFNATYEFNQPLDAWDVSHVTDMSGMFFNAWKFNQPLHHWNVSQVRKMSWMFDKAYAFNQSLNAWNVSQVTTMDEMFNNAKSFNQPLDQWNVSQVTNMRWMFHCASSFNQPLDTWDVRNVTNMKYMFDYANQFAYKANLQLKWPQLK